MARTVVTFGELMLRLSPPGCQRFAQATSFDLGFGGGEANVAVSLARLGLNAAFVSKLPAQALGDRALEELRGHGVDTRFLLRGGARLGLYYLEQGASQRASKVIYDRAGSAFAGLQPGEIDWEEAFRGADWFHWSGITPALGGHLPAILLEACRTARRLGVTVSADLNYRRTLWTPETAQACMVPLMEHVDVCLGNEEDAQRCLGLAAGATRVERGDLDLDGYRTLARTLKATFGFRAVAITLRESISASRNRWSGLLLDDRECREPVLSRTYDIAIVDRVGAGDAFAAGLIYGLLAGGPSGAALDFAVAASCLKHSIPGDFNLVTAAEVEALAAGGGAGRVER